MRVFTRNFMEKFPNGADDEARTRYLHLGKVALYQMSYIRTKLTLYKFKKAISLPRTRSFKMPFGADDEARTRYLHLGKVALYQMSYIRIYIQPRLVVLGLTNRLRELLYDKTPLLSSHFVKNLCFLSIFEFFTLFLFRIPYFFGMWYNNLEMPAESKIPGISQSIES